MPLPLASVRRLAAGLNPALPPDRIHCGPLEALPWDDGSVDAIICSAVLHFARDDEEFGAMVTEMWRVLAPGGLFFARLATSIGLEHRLPADDRTHAAARRLGSLPRRRADPPDLDETLGGTLADPLKTTNVQNMRCMTTWVMEK